MNIAKERYLGLVAERKILREEKEELEREKKDMLRLISDQEEARTFITEIARATQVNFAGVVEKLVTLVISPVFDKNVKFKLLFETKANRTQCVPMVEEGGYRYHPKDEDGGSMVDLIGFALRVSLWSMAKNRSRAVLIIDEPFGGVGKGDRMNRVGAVLKELSRKLHFQIIMNTHEKELAHIADKPFFVTKVGQRSHVATKTGQNRPQAVSDPMPVKRVKRKLRKARK